MTAVPATMMFLLRCRAAPPLAVGIAVKASRATPAAAPGEPGRTDYFCVGEASAMAALREAGHEIVELRDGWYVGDRGGGVAIWGQGRYWEIRDTPFTVREAAGPAGDAAAGVAEDGLVDVRQAVFGV